MWTPVMAWRGYKTHSWLETPNPLTMKDLSTSTIILYSVVCPESSVWPFVVELEWLAIALNTIRKRRQRSWLSTVGSTYSLSVSLITGKSWEAAYKNSGWQAWEDWLYWLSNSHGSWSWNEECEVRSNIFRKDSITLDPEVYSKAALPCTAVLCWKKSTWMLHIELNEPGVIVVWHCCGPEHIARHALQIRCKTYKFWPFPWY